MPARKVSKPESPPRTDEDRPRKRIRGDASRAPRKPSRKWSADVAKKSDALDLEKGAFASDKPKTIARSLKHSAEASHRRKSSPFRSALSMLTFYINRAGRNLSTGRRRTLMAAKDRLRQLFGRRRKLPIKRVQ